jgi:hypothetical protein
MGKGYRRAQRARYHSRRSSKRRRRGTSGGGVVWEELDHVEEVLATVERPDHREEDRRPGRERFYRHNALRPGRWMRVVVDYDEDPGWIVTVLIQEDDPKRRFP